MLFFYLPSYFFKSILSSFSCHRVEAIFCYVSTRTAWWPRPWDVTSHHPIAHSGIRQNTTRNSCKWNLGKKKSHNKIKCWVRKKSRTRRLPCVNPSGNLTGEESHISEHLYLKMRFRCPKKVTLWKKWNEDDYVGYFSL